MKNSKDNNGESGKGAKRAKAPPVLNRQVFYKHQVIIKQGATVNHAYYIEEGEVEVSATQEGHSVVLTTLGRGEIFGEMGMIQPGPRSATVTALTDCTLTVISRHDLEQRINAIKDKAVSALLKVLVNRLRDGNKRQAEHHKELKVFQDRITGVMEKSSRGIDESARARFREEVMPLLDKLEELLDSYSSKTL